MSFDWKKAASYGADAAEIVGGAMSGNPMLVAKGVSGAVGTATKKDSSPQMTGTMSPTSGKSASPLGPPAPQAKVPDPGSPIPVPKPADSFNDAQAQRRARNPMTDSMLQNT